MAEQLLGRPLSGNNIASEIVNTEEQAPSAVLGRSITGFEEPAQQEDYSTIGDIARGAGAGALNIFQGVAELGAAGIDYAADTDTGTATTNAFESVKESLGFVPTGTAGHVAEMLVNYGSLAIPIGGWIGAAGKAGQAVKGGAAVADVVTGATKIRRGAQAFGATKTGQALTGSRVARAGSTALATGLADILVSPSTNHTLADSWDALPSYLRTEDETGLTGRDQASVRLANKFKLKQTELPTQQEGSQRRSTTRASQQKEDKAVHITQVLTKRRFDLLQEYIKSNLFSKVWFIDGTIVKFIKKNDKNGTVYSSKISFKNANDLLNSKR